MSPETPADHDIRLGQALRRLRERAGLTQAEAAEEMNVTPQAWQNYESGKRRFTEARQRDTTAAVGATPADLLAEAGRGTIVSLRGEPRSFELTVDGVVRAGSLGGAAYQPDGEAEVIDFSHFFDPATNRVLRLEGESMVPYAQPGGFVTYNLKLWPRRGDGCVIVTMDGDYLVKRFDRSDGETLYVTELHPVERQLTFALKDLRGVHRIGLRGD